MVVNYQITLTRKKLYAKQFLPDQTSMILNEESIKDNDAGFLNQAVELLILIKKFDEEYK